MAAASTTPSSSIVRDHLRLGCSTGFLRDRDDLDGNWPQLAQHARATSTEAVELAALSESELPGLLAYLGGHPPLPFRFLSVHAPSKHRVMDERELVALLLPLVGQVDAIVVHPDTLDDLGAWAPLGRTLTIENMDSRKRTGRNADELAYYLRALPQAQLCFDVAHAHGVDPTLAVGHEILDRFGSRLRHLHVSALDDRGRHVTMSAQDEAAVLPLLERCRDVPWVLEAPLSTD